MHGALADIADHLDHVIGLDAARAEPSRAIDVRWVMVPAGIELEGQRLGDETHTEAVRQHAEVVGSVLGETMEEAVHTLEHRAWAGKAGPRHERGT